MLENEFGVRAADIFAMTARLIPAVQRIDVQKAERAAAGKANWRHAPIDQDSPVELVDLLEKVDLPFQGGVADPDHRENDRGSAADLYQAQFETVVSP